MHKLSISYIINRIINLDMALCRFNSALFLRAVLLLSPITLLFYQENGLTVSELFFFQSLFYLMAILSEIPIGYLSDRLSKNFVLLLSWSLFLCSTLLWLSFRGYIIILIGELIRAVAKVMMDNARSGYLYDYLLSKKNEKQISKNLGYQYLYLSLGTTVAAFIGTWLYVKFGSKTILSIEFIIILFGLFLILSLPKVYNPNKKKKSFYLKFVQFKFVLKSIYKKKAVMNYIYYSGFLTSFSIVFALSFQPLMKHAMVPVALFGLAAFFNHGLRAIFSALTGFVSKRLSIRRMIVPLYVLYIIAFCCVFIMFYYKNTFIIMSLILLICVIIGCQLMFTIRHISRLHKFVSSKNRGTIVAINNCISTSMAFISLFFSKVFMNKLGYQNYILFLFIIFITIGFFIMIRTFKVTKEV